MFKFTEVFKVRIIYKSGYAHDLEVTKFAIKQGKWEWEMYKPGTQPIMLSVDEVAAVFQVGVSNKLQWK